MKLRSLALSNVRKFAGQTATISGIGDGVSVVSEANEFGKSTFFDALHALFFLKYSGATREVKSLQPRSGGPVRISAQIELEAGIFTLEKSFLAQKRALVRDATDKVIALDDEAEQWIAQLMGSGLDGPAGLLWVRQGTSALEPAGNTGADKTEKERLLGARRNLLSSVAGEIDMVTGGRRMDRVISAAVESLGRLATATGQPKTGGPWKQAEQEAQTYAARLAELERACQELGEALDARREVARQLASLEAPQAVRAREDALAQAQAAFQAAQAHADRLTQAQNTAALRQLELDQAQAALDALIAAQNAQQIAEKALEIAAGAVEEAGAQATEADSHAQNAAQEHAARRDELARLVSLKEASQQSALRTNADEKLAQLTTQLAQIVEKRDALEAARAALCALSVTPAALAQIEAAQQKLDTTEARAAQNTVRITLAYDGDLRASISGQPVDAGSHSITQAQDITLPGIGRMTVDPGLQGTGSDDAIVQAKVARDGALARVSMPSLEAARDAAARRARGVADITMLETVLKTLAPEGVGAVQEALARAQTAVSALSTSRNDFQDEAVDPAALAEQIALAQTAENDARAIHEDRRDRQDAARTTLLRAQDRLEGAEKTAHTAARSYGDADTFDARKAEVARAASVAQVGAQDAQRAATDLEQAAPDMATAQADLSRAKSAADNARQDAERLRTRAAALSATIRARAEDGVEEKCAEVADLLAAATERAARFAHEAAGLTQLVAALRAKRGAAQDAYFGPVQQELAPLLALLHADAALSFDPTSMLPQGLARAGTQEPVEMLSGGTQEQIAILTRLAFARLFAKQGKPMPVILDDALVFSDDSRIRAMFTALHRVAANQQVIVFSCRQMAFADLGGTRPHIDVVQDV
ncbi:MAG: hypothetical protein WBG95_02395 [Sulfitobacter sp.]